MTWLAPGFLVAGVVGALAVVALHLIALQRPQRYPLPTARFVPPAAARAASLTSQPTDLVLLLLRALAILLLGAAFARPVLTPARTAVRQVLIVDRTDANASATELRDSVAAYLQPGDALILLDSVAVPGTAADVDSLAGAALVHARASLAAGLIAARRTAALLADSTDSARMVVVSPFARESVVGDASFDLVRAGWPGALLPVRVTGRVDSASLSPIAVPDGDDDPLVAGARLAGAVAAASVRLWRDQPVDSAWATEGGVALVWPSSLPQGWSERPVPDTVGALVVAGRAVLVAPLERWWSAPEGIRVVARWVDGEPAAVEQPLGTGCIRTVGVPLPVKGDVTLRPEFATVLRALSAPCGGARELTPVGEGTLERIAGNGVPTVSLDPLRPANERSPLVPWLLALAMSLLLVEWLVRSRPSSIPGAAGAPSTDALRGAHGRPARKRGSGPDAGRPTGEGAA